METNFCDHGSLREFVCELFFSFERLNELLHHVIILFLMCMLYIMHTMYFTILNNPLHAELR